ncbi:MAG: hypothetical protein ACOH13_05875 [Flavobacteriales bacterium]
MRLLLIALSLLCGFIASAQPELPCEPRNLPAWMQRVAWGTKPVASTLSKRAPLHTNAYIGTWSVQKTGGRRYDFWSDKHRVVIQEFNQRGERKRMYYIDLDANVRMDVHMEKDQALFIVEDLQMPQAGYFREIWSDSVRATGRTETLLGAPCQVELGTDGNNDTTYYWRTDQYPALFADMRVWAPWLCREGDLKFLTALSAEPAGGCLRAEWPKRRFGPEAGSIAVLAITPGAAPMPTLEANQRMVVEHRFRWMNNTGIGRLPPWMRAYVSTLPADMLPAAYTPKPVKRDIPDNQFIGTITAETPTTILGLPDKNTGRDTTYRVAKYSYWADARRAVLQLEDPDDEGYIFYAVDLDADVVMVSRNEMHSYVIPKLEISTLETVGLAEFGRGLELDFTSQGKYRTILGRKCELNTTSERYLQYIMIPTDRLVNPVYDIKNWMAQRISQKFKDLMFFGVADRPMPMAVMGTTLTSYKPGKAKPPVVDLGNYRVRDERLREKKRDKREYETVETREYSIDDMRGMDVAVPTEEVLDVTGDPDPHVMETETPRHSAGGSGSGTGTGTRGAGDIPPLSPLMDEVMKHSTNHFIGTALLQYTSVKGDVTTTWTVRYASDADRMVMIGNEDAPLPSDHNRAYLIYRKAGLETLYQPKADGSPVPSTSPLLDAYASKFPLAYADSLIAGNRKFLGHLCVQRSYETPTTSRTVWSDSKSPSLFWDILGARKRWNAIEILMRGPMITSTTEGMPMEVNYEYHGGERMTMRVLELTPGPVDPKVFEITKDSWRR